MIIYMNIPTNYVINTVYMTKITTVATVQDSDDVTDKINVESVLKVIRCFQK
jgi:hypothetical protein